MGRLIITGPSGWIGQALLACLSAAGDSDALRAEESLALFGSRSSTLAGPSGSPLAVRPLADITPGDVDGAMVIHLAYLTKDKIDAYGEPAFRNANTAIDGRLLTAMSEARPRSVFVASSGAARLADEGVDRNAYGLAKLEQEARFLDFGRTASVPVLCGRIYNLAGPHINKLDAYAVSNFAVQAMAGGPVRIAADRPVFRSFLHVTDLCRLILRAVRDCHGEDRPIDLCGAEVLEMGDIAALVIAALGGETTIERGPIEFGRRSDYLGCAQDTQVLAMRLGLRTSGAAAQVRDTIHWIRERVREQEPQPA